MSESRAFRVTNMGASTFRYAPHSDRATGLCKQIVALAYRLTRHGVGMIH